MLEVDNKIFINHIKPEWFRRMVAEEVVNGKSITLQIHINDDQVLEYPVQLIDIKTDKTDF